MKVFVFLALVTLMLPSCRREPLLDLHKSDGQKSYEEFMAGITGTRYEAPEERKQNIFSNYSRLRVGMTKQEIASIIGTPDYSQASYGPKGPGEKWLGWSWSYYLVWPDTRFVNEAQDELIQIFFDTKDRATWIALSSKTQLPHLGGPRNTLPN